MFTTWCPLLVQLTLLAAPVTVHVAPNGQDGAAGTAAAPFATLTRARDALRAAPRDQPRTMLVHAGRYRVTSTLELGPADAGLIVRAAPGEQVRLAGGARLTKWQRVTDPAVLARLTPAAREAVRQIGLKAAGVTDLGRPVPVGGPAAQLVNVYLPPTGRTWTSQYLPLARYPNAGQWAKVAGVPQDGPEIKAERPHHGRWTYDGDRPSGWKDLRDLWVHGYWVFDWADQYQRVQKLDLAKKEVWPALPYHHYGYQQGQRYYFLNVLEELDAAGEWYLDRATATLYFIPPAPDGQFELLFPELAQPMFALKDTSHVRLAGLTLEASRDAAVVISGGEHNEVLGCTIRNFGAQAAVTISGEHNGLTSCDVYQNAGTGVALNGGDRQTLKPGGNYVDNCDLHHCGQIYRTYHGAVQMEGVGQRLAHCAIHDLPHQGIGYGGNDHVIEYCDFTRIAQETGDVGVTYAMADWTSQGHEFRYNYFHNIHGPGNLGCFTIYPDLPNGGIHLHHNIFYDVDQVFHTNSGRAMVIENNLFYRCNGMSFSVWTQDHMFKPGGAWGMVENLAKVHYDQPPYSTRYPTLLHLAADFALGEQRILERERPKDNLVRRNVSWGSWFVSVHPQAGLQDVRLEDNVIADEEVFRGSFDASGQGRSYRNGDPDVAARLGHTGNRIVAGDPGFGGLATQDFQLTANSPAHLVKFEPIPFAKIGLRRDAFRHATAAAPNPPTFVPAPGSFVGQRTVKLLPTPDPHRRLVLRYSLGEHTWPTAESPVWQGPLTLTQTTTIRAAAFAADEPGLSSPIVTATYKLLALDRGAVYLSDLPEQELRVYSPCWKKDTNHLGGPIKLAGVEYPKGLLLHPDVQPDGKGWARVEYSLTGTLARVKRFKAVIGIDDAMEHYHLGSAGFIVEVLRGGQWQRVYESPVLKLGGQPVKLEVDIAGAERLRLLVTDGGDGIACDHATWADARVQ